MKKLKTILVVTAVLATMLQAAVADTIVLWDFQDPDDHTCIPQQTPSFGSGSIFAFGGASFKKMDNDWDDTYMGGYANSSSDPIHVLYPDFGYGMEFANFSIDPSKYKQSGVQVNVSTLGYMNIVVQLDVRVKRYNSKYFRLQYSIDGVNFVDYGNEPFEANMNYENADHWYNDLTMDLTGIAGVDNNPNFAFRFVQEYAPGTTTYVTAQTPPYEGTKTVKDGAWRFDMVEVTGTPVPEPGSILALGCGALTLAGAALRKRLF